jgi:cytochrome b
MVKVWDLPLRLFHWSLATSVLIAWFTANIFNTVHEIAGYTVLGLIAFRLLWGFAGTLHSRFADFVPHPAVALRYMGKLARGSAARHLGHNPAGAAMIVTLLLILTVCSISGWMQITVRFFGVTWVEQVHSYSADLVLILAVVHVLGVLFMSALHRENLVRAMITGTKELRTEDQAADR